MGSDSITNETDAVGGGGGVQIPASVKKVVQNLKEIVNNSCTDSEIYAVLRDCNMDPSDAVQRLLSQDTFHEVKSKRERRKEMKETQELKTRANGCASNRGVRDGIEHSFGQSGSILNSYNDKVAYKKENGSVSYMPHSASSKLHTTEQTLNEQLFLQSSSFDADHRGQSIGTGDIIDSSMQPSYGSQSSWVGSTLENVAMADIVRMGRPKSKGSQMSCETSYSLQDADPPNATIYQMKPSLPTSDSKLGTDQDFHSSDLNMTSESRKKSSQHGFDNEWAVNEPLTGSGDIGGVAYSNQSCLHGNKSNLSSNCWSDNILVSESNVGRKNLSPNPVNSAQASNKQIFMSDYGGTPEYDNDLRKDTHLPDSYGQIYEHLEAGRGSNASAPSSCAPLSDDAIKAASSVAVNLQQLRLGKEEVVVTPKEDNCGVVLPDYLQTLSAECSHLSFGTYKSGKNSSLPQPQSSSLTNNLEETLMNLNGCSTSMHLDSRNLVDHDKEQLEFDYDSHRATVNARNYNSPKFSESELRKLDIPDAATLGNDYVSCASIPGSSFKNIKQSSSLSLVIDPNARNLPVLPSDMQSHPNSMPSDILAAAFQSTKARDSAAFLTSPSVSSRYISSASSIKNPVVSMSQPSSHVLHGANSATVPVLKEHYASYPQNGYPAAPQGHTYTPSDLRQAFPDGNVFHEPHTDMKYDHRQHYGSASMSSSSLPWLNSYASGYQSLENPSNSPRTSLHNLLSGGSSGSKLAYDNFLRSQYSNGGANFNLPQQNGGAATWDYGHGSRIMSTIPDNANYSLHGQNRLLAGYQPGQQQSQQLLHGGLGYPGFYGSHASTAQQPQNLRNLILNASQGPSSRQLPQTWQNNY